MAAGSNSRSAIVFAEQFYYPDGWGGAQLPRDITIHLVEQGWAVEVVCGSDPYAPPGEEQVADPVAAGVHIRRVPRLFSGDIHRWKLARQIWYYIAALPLLISRSCALYIVQTNPPLLVPMAALAAIVRRRRFVIIAQDLYPEVMLAHGMVRQSSLAARVLRSLFRWAYRRADRVISLGPTMSRRLQEKGVDPRAIVRISNWATGDEQAVVRGGSNRLRSQWGLTDKFVLLYSGNLGIAHDIETPLRAVQLALASIPNLVLVVIGKGSRLREAQELAAKLGIMHAVQFRPLVPFELLPHSLGLADVALVTLRQGFEGLVVPSKLLGYMARGIPTIYVGPDSDASCFIEDSASGLVFRNDDAESLARALVPLAADADNAPAMGESGRRYYVGNMTRSIGLQKYTALVTDLIGAPVQRENR
jgi:colanic acid biosynthesis glycosyl transferase WcaI